MLTAQSHKAGKLELIIGCMFSGKSTELISRIRKHKIIGSSYLVLSHQKDNRYDTGHVVSHDLDKEISYPCLILQDLFETQEYQCANVLFIEEAQFFHDLFDFCYRAVEIDGKHVIVSGLDGDFQRKPFGQVLDLIPISDDVMKLTALCAICITIFILGKNGQQGMFSKRIITNDEVELVGGLETYLPVCRYHFHN